MTDGIHVRLAVSACDRCPVATLSKTTAVEELRVDPIGERVEFVASDPPSDPPNAMEFVEFAGRAHGRCDLPRSPVSDEDGVKSPVSDEDGVKSPVSDEDGVKSPVSDEDGMRTAISDGGGVRTAVFDDERTSPSADDGVCGDCSCGGITSAFEAFPVAPCETRMDDGELLVSFVLTGHEELEAIVDGFEAAGLRAELRRLLVDRGDDDDRFDVVPVDLAGVTARQAEVAAVAAEKGYFDPDGASAEEIAAELDLAKSTVSEHLRLVTATLFSQLFADGGA